MKRSLVAVSCCMAGLLIAVAMAGCGGTEAGNPSGSEKGSGGGQNPAVTLLEAVCGKLTVCFGQETGLTEEECKEVIAESETLGRAFGGVDEESPLDYGQVIEEVESGGLSVDQEAVAECVRLIGSLECGEAAVQAVDIEQGFENIEQMIPEPACSEVFSVQPAG